MTITTLDVLELIKIGIIVIVGFIIIKALITNEVNHQEIKYACDCCNNLTICLG